MQNKSEWTYRLAERLYDRRWIALGVVLAVTVLATIPALQVGVDTAVQHWFTEGDPALEAYRNFQDTYGNDEVVLVGLRRSDGMLSPEGISLLHEATDRVRSIDGVASVTSLTTQSTVQTTLAGPELVPLVPKGTLSAGETERLRKRVVQDSTYNRFLSDDETMAAIYARMENNATIDGHRGVILDSIRDTLASTDASVHLAGTGVILNALNEAAIQDSFIFVVASSFLIFLLLWGYFRRIEPVVLTLGVVTVATVWLMGAYGLAGKNINMVTVVMPTLILVVCVADCVHLLIYAGALPDSLSPRERTVQTLSALATPCLLTTITTAAGFASLRMSSMSIVRDLGVFSAVGVSAGLVAAFVGCAVGIPYDTLLPDRPVTSWVSNGVDRIVNLGARLWQPVVVVTGGVVVLSITGVTFLTADTNPIGYLFPDHRVRQDSERIERTLGPYAPLEFLVHPEGTGMQSTPKSDTTSVVRPGLLKAVGRWQDRAVATGMVRWHQSAVDDLRRLHEALPRGRRQVPEDPGRLQGLLELGRGQRPYLEDLYAHPGQLRVTYSMPIQSADGIRRTIDSVRTVADLPENATIQATGYLPLYVRMTTRLTDSMVYSFGLAMVVILGVIAILFRSVQAAILSILPNGLPVLFSLGVMGWASIPVDMATMTVAAVVFGLVVDDTIHLLHRYTTALKSTSIVSAIQMSARETGRRMVITTTVLAGGFLVLCFAQIKSIVWLGLLSAVAIVVALGADLLVLPAVLRGLYGEGNDS